LLKDADVSEGRAFEILENIILKQEEQDKLKLESLIEQRRKRLDAGTLQQVQISSQRDVLKESKVISLTCIQLGQHVTLVYTKAARSL
jgi:hypothetical protein